METGHHQQAESRRETEIYLEEYWWNVINTALLLYSGDFWNTSGIHMAKQKGQGENIVEGLNLILPNLILALIT